MKNKGTKQKSKKKGSENAFGCDLTEHLQSSGQDVPQVLKKCAEFIEKYGIVDGIYRLSGVTSNIQRLRQEFCSEACPDLTKEVYLQDIHCVGSLCKLYFRELPNPLLTYELYRKFTEAVLVPEDHERLLHIQEVIKELPTPHFRTLEYLSKHLAHLATLSTQTNMHTRNLALVWAPNLLRSKDIESSSGNGDMAFQEVRKQQSVVEFILNHTEQIFCGASVQVKPKEGPSWVCGEKYATLPIGGQTGPMKLMSLEEAQARSLSPNHPVHKERQRENSLPDTSTATLYHTVIDISDNKKRFSGKSKKWKSIFNLGRSVDTKGKLSRNGSVFIRTQGMTEKTALRPSRSMESLCSLTPDDERTGSSSPSGGHSSIFIPDVKSRTLGSDSLCDLSENDQTWEFKGKKTGGATASWSSGMNQKELPGASAPPQKILPEQLKVFKGDDLTGYKPTSPKNRRMLYSGSSHSSSSRPSFPGSFFPLESSPRHQRRAVNISEPFAVSVPLRVSAVISSNSTPCRGHNKDKTAALKPCKEPPEHMSKIGKSNTFPLLEAKKQEGTGKKNTEVTTPRVSPQDKKKEVMLITSEGRNVSKLEAPPCVHAAESKDATPISTEDQHHRSTDVKPDGRPGIKMWPHLPHELNITEPDIDVLHETFKPVFAPVSTCENPKLTLDVKSKRSRSSPSLSLLCREQSSNTFLSEHVIAIRSDPKKKQPSESDLSFCLHKNLDVISQGNTQNIRPADMLSETKKPTQQTLVSLRKEELAPFKQIQFPFKETSLDQVISPLTREDISKVTSFSGGINKDIKSQKPEITQEDVKISRDGTKVNTSQRLSLFLEQRHNTLELSILDDEEVYGGNTEELDLVEPWEDLSSNKQWVTSPLHSPDLEELFNQLSPFSLTGEALSSDVGKLSFPSANNTKQSPIKCSEQFSGSVPQGGPETKWAHIPTKPARLSFNNSTQPQTTKSSTAKQKNSVSSQKFRRQMSHEFAGSDQREENHSSKNRPYSLNLDLGHRCIRDISNQQNCNSLEFSFSQRGLATPPVHKGHSELDLFLNDRQAPLRRNSAPVSVSSVRTAFMIKTCQAKAVPVIPPKVQYSQIPQPPQENESKVLKDQIPECLKVSPDISSTASPSMSDLKEELENKKPCLKLQKQANVEKSFEFGKTTSTPELPVITRRHIPNVDVFVDCPRTNKGNLLQRPSFRNRQRPQSLILLSPPFPIMDYPPSGDDGKLLSSIKSLNDTSAVNVFSKEIAENFRTPDGITLQNKMTIPKSGQRLETSTSCFYQPQRRSMIFDSRSHRQIE